MINFLDWVARASGLLVIFGGIAGFIFKEKWKQILQRSLAEDLERLKSELTKEQAQHAASLAPQLEQIKHDFQQKLEAYKVTLIAETEAVKAKGELRKTIALRYSEIEFERLIALEHVMASLITDLLPFAILDVEFKSAKNHDEAIDGLKALNKVVENAEMFVTPEHMKTLLDIKGQLLKIVDLHIGHGKPVLAVDGEAVNELIQLRHDFMKTLRSQINSLGKL
jgi:hypothetical protein